jgi:hypothetical protein
MIQAILLALIFYSIGSRCFPKYIGPSEASASTRKPVIKPPDVREQLRLKKRARLEAHYKKISTPRWD